MLILNPSMAIASKQKRHLLKRTTKRRQIEAIKPYIAYKRRRREEAKLRAENMK
jgi:hypothetical protein